MPDKPFVDEFIEADTEAREAVIDETTRQIHLARQFIRYDKAKKLCRDPKMQAMLEKYKQEVLKLMQRG